MMGATALTLMKEGDVVECLESWMKLYGGKKREFGIG